MDNMTTRIINVIPAPHNMEALMRYKDGNKTQTGDFDDEVKTPVLCLAHVENLSYGNKSECIAPMIAIDGLGIEVEQGYADLLLNGKSCIHV